MALKQPLIRGYDSRYRYQKWDLQDLDNVFFSDVMNRTLNRRHSNHLIYIWNDG